MTDINDYIPSPVLDQGMLFLANLGSFWSDIFSGRQTLAAHHTDVLRQFSQEYIDYLEVVACLSRFQVPVYHRQNWSMMTLQQSQRNSQTVDPITYGQSDLTYGGGEVYGQSQTINRFRYPLPDTLVNVAQILNRPIEPSVIWTQGIEYRLDVANRYIEFLQDPFDIPLFGTRSTLTTAGTADLSIDLWLCGSQYDWQLIHEQFGYALGLYLTSSESYRDLVNAYWDALSQGPTALTLRRGLAAACQLPLVREVVETVEQILFHPDRLQVVTDEHVYDYPAASQLANYVVLGAQIHQGDLLTTALQVFERPTSNTNGINTLAGLAVGREFCTLPLQGSLTFLNQTVNTEYAANDGTALVVFTGIDGFETDIETFWSYVNNQASLNPRHSIAHALSRVPSLSSPAPANIPPTVNPMYFVLDQLMGANCILVHVDINSLGPDSDIRSLQFLRQVLPAHVALLFNAQSTIDTASYTTDGSIGPNATGLLGTGVITTLVLDQTNYQGLNATGRAIEAYA